jgi:type I restriction enzyme S subunit
MKNHQYIKVPSFLTLAELKDNDYVLAPSKYSRFVPNNNVKFRTLDAICTKSKNIIFYDKKQLYNYSEIGDIDVNNGNVNSSPLYGLHLPSEKPKKLQQGDILISTVRTYRGGIGYVYKNLENHCCSPVIFVIRETDNSITKEYLLTVLRTNFFIEQILGFQNRGLYPRLDKNAMKHILIPIPKSESTIQYITILTKAYLNKIALIKQRHATILQTIEKELLDNQKPNIFKYELPNYREILDVGRLDTGLYSSDFKTLDFLISNYTNDFELLKNLKYQALRGPNLAVSVIGTTHYTDKPLSEKFYKLIQPVDLSDYGTICNQRYFGNANDIQLLKIGDILFSAEGTIGKICVIIDLQKRAVTNYHGMSITNSTAPLYQKCFVGCFFFWLRQKKYFDFYSVGGQGGSFGKQKTENIKIPNFPETKQKEIAKLYHNPECIYDTADFTLDNFLEKDNAFNATAGIYELDKTAKQLKSILNQAIDDIVADKKVNISFNADSQ